MSQQNWSDILKTGILWQDAQHRHFFEIRDALVASSQSANIKLFEKTLVQLDQYMVEHFAMEALYMEQTGFPGLIEHMKEHEIFSKKLARAKREFLEYKQAKSAGEEVGLNPWLDLSLELEIWFVEHIQGSDHKLSKHLKQAHLL